MVYGMLVVLLPELRFCQQNCDYIYNLSSPVAAEPDYISGVCLGPQLPELS